jgi:large subunit ribosomal protein L54
VKVKAAALGAAMAGLQKRKYLDVETDPEKLVNYVVGANIYKEGEDPKIKPDSEYPDWLWELRTTREVPDPEDLPFDSDEYWKRVRKLNRRRTNLMKKTKHKFGIFD